MRNLAIVVNGKLIKGNFEEISQAVRDMNLDDDKKSGRLVNLDLHEGKHSLTQKRIAAMCKRSISYKLDSITIGRVSSTGIIYNT